MEDQPADPGDLTTGPSAESTPAPRRRRWSLLRRRHKESAEAAADSGAAQEAATAADTPAPQPVGKAKRRGRTSVETTDDKTVDTSAEEVAASEPEEAETETVASELVATEPEAAETEAVEPDPSDEPAVVPQEVRFVPHRPAGKRLIAAMVAAAVLFVGAAAFAASTLQPYLSERAEINTKLDVARTAASAISTLWTYTPDNMETLPERSAAFLGGDFAYEYRKYIDAIVATNKQAQVTNTTQVMGAAVETLTPDEATAIVYTNSVATSPMSKNIPSLRYLSYRLTMERRDAKWLITNMSTITSLDLTPQL
ncbi:MCE associated membrane protein [Mycolicibacterium flavescens]|uniref:mammalian cell entry protein n=1 Tax=Mycobacterium neumannii TaxID=2048551 RepID=UPI000B940ACA|nr:mammalian cell entry protein [Mycobacterium neumannii]VEG37873.1 MCE associated membrane protein [Mycolicibacterium flavescens]